jgi:hypothetical protein
MFTRIFMRLTAEQKNVLRALAEDSFLKSHRYLDGTKVYRLHPLNGPVEDVQRATVDRLVKRKLVTSNQKFPAATYTITEKGRALAAKLK